MQFSAFKYRNVLKTFLLAGLELKFLKKLFRDYSLHPPQSAPCVIQSEKQWDERKGHFFVYMAA